MQTPIQEYSIANNVVFVKRDDLYSPVGAPPIAKMRGLQELIATRKLEGVNIFCCFQSKVSRIGEALGYVCDQLDVRALIVIPKVNSDSLRLSCERIKEFGGEIIEVRNNVLDVCYSQTKKIAALHQAYVLPFGMECEEALESIRQEASSVPAKYYENGTLVVCCGSGVTVSGILQGLKKTLKVAVGVSSGRAKRNIEKCVTRIIGKLPNNLYIQEPIHPYSKCAAVSAPFPCDPYYDGKAWEFLLRHLDGWTPPVLFWNLGGSYSLRPVAQKLR